MKLQIPDAPIETVEDDRTGTGVETLKRAILDNLYYIAAKNPSIWTRDVHFVRRYEKHGPLWLPAFLESESRIVIAGVSSLKIEYSNYQIEPATEPESHPVSAGN